MRVSARLLMMQIITFRKDDNLAHRSARFISPHTFRSLIGFNNLENRNLQCLTPMSDQKRIYPYSITEISTR